MNEYSVVVLTVLAFLEGSYAISGLVAHSRRSAQQAKKTPIKGTCTWQK